MSAIGMKKETFTSIYVTSAYGVFGDTFISAILP